MDDWAQLNAQRIALEDQINAAEMKLDEQRRLAQPNREQMAYLSSIIEAGLVRLRPINDRLAQTGTAREPSASTAAASQPGLGSSGDGVPPRSSGPV